MLRINPTRVRQQVYNKQRSDFTIVEPGKPCDDEQYDIPSDWPSHELKRYQNPKIYAVINTYGNPPHLIAAIHSVFNHVDGFVILHNGSWSGRNEPNKIPDLLQQIDWAAKEVFIEDVSNKNFYGKQGQLRQRTYGFNFMQEGDWYFCVDDDEIWDDENVEKFTAAMRERTDVLVMQHSMLAYWQKPTWIGWTEWVCSGFRKVPDVRFVNVRMTSTNPAGTFPIERVNCTNHHFSWVNSDQAIYNKMQDYTRRAKVGDFKSLKDNYIGIWYRGRQNRMLNNPVHPLPGYAPGHVLHESKVPLPKAFTKYSEFGYDRDAKTLSVIVVTYNSANVLQDMLRSFMKQKPKNYIIDFILVDNNSKQKKYLETAIKYIEEQGLKVNIIRNRKNLKFTRAVNQGLEITNGNWILLLNPDVIFTQSSWMNGLVSVSEDLEAGIIAPKMLHADGTIHFAGGEVSGEQYSHIGRNKKDSKDFDAPSLTKWVTGACMLIKRDVFLALGSLDIKYEHYMSDNKYCEKAIAHGFNVAYAGKKSVITHFCGKSCS